MAVDLLRDTYRVGSTFAPFFSGGAYCFSSDGEQGFFTDGDQINLIALHTGRTVTSITSTGEPEAISFHSSSRMLINCASSHLITSYTVTEGPESKIEIIKQWKGHQQPINSVDFHPSGVYVATAGSDGTARVWDAKQGFCTHNFKDHAGRVTLVKSVDSD